MKFYDFLNEARINYKSATAEEIAKGILENYGNDKTKARQGQRCSCISSDARLFGSSLRNGLYAENR